MINIIRNKFKKINIKKLENDAKIPTYGTDFSAGCDLYACSKEKISFNPGETKLIKTGIAMELPECYAGLIYARSGLATKRGLAPANKVGVIDSDYRGEIMVALHNHTNEVKEIDAYERIAQLVVTPYIKAIFNEVDKLNDTIRGTSGFGSTGKK